MLTFGVLPLVVIAVLAAAYRVALLNPATAWILTGTGWLVYFVYEALMQARVLCSGECNIRVDLLLIWPALILATLAAGVATFRSWRRSRQV